MQELYEELHLDCSKLRGDYNDLETTKFFVEHLCSFSNIELEGEKVIKQCMVEVLLKTAESASDEVIHALWKARSSLHRIVVTRDACCRGWFQTGEKGERLWEIIVPSLDWKDRELVKFTLAHEFAHGILGDMNIAAEELDQNVGKLTEHRANVLAIAWGFKLPPQREAKKNKKRGAQCK